MDDYGEVYFFYLDYRDSRFYEGGSYGTDIWLKYNYANSKFSYSADPGSGFTEIANGNTKTVWQIFGVSGPPDLTTFQPTDPTSLSIQWSGGHPLLQWTASSEPSPVKYHIWRANQYIAFTTGASYSDQDVVGGGGSITYKVRAVSYDETKDSQNFTNSVTINGLYQNKRGAQVTKLNTVTQYELGDNYPKSIQSNDKNLV